MEFFDLVNISERYLELSNPSTPEKVLTAGEYLRLHEGDRVIDVGCGCGTVLDLWAEHFEIRGVGIDIRPEACDRARQKLAEWGLAEGIEIVCASGNEYVFEDGAYDAAACIGASFIWGGYRPTLQALKRAIGSGGRIVIGEPYWRSDNVPAEYADTQEHEVHTEFELLRMTREEGFDFEYVVRASHDDWDAFEAGNWHGLIRWLEENPNHPERSEVIAHLHRSQDEYTRYGRQYLGWAMYVLAPRSDEASEVPL